MQGDKMDEFPVELKDVAELGLAKTCRALCNQIEYRLDVLTMTMLTASTRFYSANKLRIAFRKRSVCGSRFINLDMPQRRFI